MSPKRGYSNYESKKHRSNNRIKVSEGSIIVANLSDYEKIPKSVIDHKKESVVVLKASKEELGVVLLHGKENLKGDSRKRKKDSGLWEEIIKNGQEVYVDLDIRVSDAHGNPIKQGKVFKNTGVVLEAKELEKVENHIYYANGRKRHSIRKTIDNNRQIKAKKNKE